MSAIEIVLAAAQGGRSKSFVGHSRSFPCALHGAGNLCAALVPAAESPEASGAPRPSFVCCFAWQLNGVMMNKLAPAIAPQELFHASILLWYLNAWKESTLARRPFLLPFEVHLQDSP